MKLYIGENEIKGVGFHVTAGDIKDATTEPEEVLAGQYFYNNNGRQTGTMPNRGAVSAALNAGESVTIPEGYHNGEGKVTANSLASQTPGTAAAADIVSGKTAWVNGEEVTGTGSKVTVSTVTFTSSNTSISTTEEQYFMQSQFSGYVGVGNFLVHAQNNKIHGICVRDGSSYYVFIKNSGTSLATINKGDTFNVYSVS